MEAVGWVPWRVDSHGLHRHGEQQTAMYLHEHGGGASVAVDDFHDHSLKRPWRLVLHGPQPWRLTSMVVEVPPWSWRNLVTGCHPVMAREGWSSHSLHGSLFSFIIIFYVKKDRKSVV